MVQDDTRERELIGLFGLQRVEGAGRADTDAELIVDEVHIPFELKSSTDNSVTTVRDFGAAHVTKWKGKHWLIGFYEKDGSTLKYCVYGSPESMAPWVREKEEYIRLDFQIAQSVPALLGLEMVHSLLGPKDVYSVQDAQVLHKRQYSAEQYKNRCDLPVGYSPQRMLEILKDRCAYLIRRGSTLNNPHIPGGYFQGWERITTDHSKRLRILVAEALAREANSLKEAAQAALRSARATDTAT